jgi:oligosaccharyltransferase complex subunit epsilon
MAPKKNASAASQAPKSTTPLATTTGTTAQPDQPSVPVTRPATVTSSKRSASRNPQTPQEILASIWNTYVDETPQRSKLLDVFMGFLLVVGGLQFVYCVIAGNYVSFQFLVCAGKWKVVRIELAEREKRIIAGDAA